MEFAGFSKKGIRLLAELPGLSKQEFSSKKSEWESLVWMPAKVFVEALGEEIQSKISSNLVVQAKVNGSLSPIHKDLRFSKDKSSLYKDHLLINFWEGQAKKTAPTLRVRLSSEGVGFATGAVFTSTSLIRWRDAIDDAKTGAQFGKLVNAIEQKYPIDFTPPELKRVPSPYSADHPRAQWLLHKSFQMRWMEKLPGEVNSAEFVDWCAEYLIALKPIHLWLVKHLE